MNFQLLDPDVMRRQFNMDAVETAFFDRSLLYVYNKTYDRKYPNLRAREFVPVGETVSSGATSIATRSWDHVGKAKIIGNKAKDIPRVDVMATENIRPVRLAALGYGYDIMEMKQAAFSGTPLDMKRAMACRRGIEEILDLVACFGSPEDGIATGFLNDPNIPVVGASAAWATLDSDDILADLSGLFEAIDTLTKGVERPDTLLLPTSVVTAISTKPRSSVSDTTVKKFIMDNFGLKKIEGWYRLNSAGVGGTTRAVLYTNDADHVNQDITNEFEQLPVQIDGLEFVINCLAQTAGTVWNYPKSATFIDGV